VVNLSGSQLALVVVFAIAQAVLGYFLSEADRRNLGRTPWGLPSLVWALIWFLSLLVAIILFVIAHRSEVRRGAVGAYGTPGQMPPSPAAASAQPKRVGTDFPAYPRPATGDVAVGALVPPSNSTPPNDQTATGLGAHVPLSMSPPEWQPDPSGRFHYRWWTGQEWTSYVSTLGQIQVDTSPDQRIGPY